MAYLTPEKRVQNTIIEYLEPYDHNHRQLLYWERRNASGPTYKKGMPDLYVCIGPYHFEVEVKAPDKERSTLQEKWEQRFKRIGMFYIVTDSLEKFIEFVGPYLEIKIKESDNQ